MLRGIVEVFREEGTAAGRLSCPCLDMLWPEQPFTLGTTTLFTCPRSLRSLPHMSALRALNNRLWLPHSDAEAITALLRCILRSVLSLPSLTTLDIHAARDSSDDPMPEADWTDDALPSPASLRHLSLSELSLSAASLRQVCSLLVESLRMTDCTVLAGKDTAVVSIVQPSASALEKVVFSAIGSHALQLRELELDHCTIHQSSGLACDFSPLMTQAGAPHLPHLTKLSLSDIGAVTEREWWQPGLDQACSTASQRLVAAYCAQLTSLHVLC